MCHRILTGRETLSSSTVVITSCTNHYVKNILNHVKRYYPDDEKTAFYIARCVGLVFEMKNYEKINIGLSCWRLCFCQKSQRQCVKMQV